jgi:hypothetical protein
MLIEIIKVGSSKENFGQMNGGINYFADERTEFPYLLLILSLICLLCRTCSHLMKVYVGKLFRRNFINRMTLNIIC